MEAAGIEPGPKSSGNRGVGNQSGANSGALGARAAGLADAPTDPGLARLVTAWPTLPEEVRARVLKMLGLAE
jgi:hypothetical protein